MSHKSKNFNELIQKFIDINNNLVRIRNNVEIVCDIRYDSKDARMLALDSLQQSIIAVGMWIQCYISLAHFHLKEGSFNEQRFLQSLGSGLDLVNTEKRMFDHLKYGFITLAHFTIDNLFHNILKELHALPSETTGYGALKGLILKKCSLLENGYENDILTAFAYLRNSLHNNGIHRNNSLTITIEGMEFKFIKGSRVKCASWDHIVVLLRANVEVLERILKSDVVKNIKTEIRDDFASGL